MPVIITILTTEVAKAVLPKLPPTTPVYRTILTENKVILSRLTFLIANASIYVSGVHIAL
jgi:hypothetical protein